ncbi:MAG: hypothetical protein AVDCRST_MAG93-927 [uncultured Chloroflexia bacterium]|uniref:Abi-like protein n=1 Tax=uncultured Chloroflexia bacterium TaxID=1672391 RepID=A0A6J4HUC0_9CHLR|nr:MAG: hypothetical protein AVDCRST_MAG93-927 [uncultured Chloroflexia bacterium]
MQGQENTSAERGATEHDALERVLSTERLTTYVSWAAGDKTRALQLYALNTALSEALYTPLQMLEVALRNRFHTTLSAAHGPFWFNAADFLKVGHQVEQLQKAKELLREQGKPLEPGRIVAALTFGFWTALLNTVYEDVWRTTLYRAMQPEARDEKGRGLNRKSLTRPLTPLRELRNRVAHHEPILEWNLPKHHTNILRITNWLSPAAASWTQAQSRFPSVYPPQPIVLGKSHE